MHKLEVIVMSAAEAKVAEAAGADRLELVRDLDAGGLTPDLAALHEVLAAVRIPVRVMLRENETMHVAGGAEMAMLVDQARAMKGLPIDGIVMGWVTAEGSIDSAAMVEALRAAGEHKVTFHRAFEHLDDPFAGLKTLKTFAQIDRILTGGGVGSWTDRKSKLQQWSAAAQPEITILAGGGLADAEAFELMADPQFPEVHVGRAARTPAVNNGAIDPEKIRRLKQAAR